MIDMGDPFRRVAQPALAVIVVSVATSRHEGRDGGTATGYGKHPSARNAALFEAGLVRHGSPSLHAEETIMEVWPLPAGIERVEYLKAPRWRKLILSGAHRTVTIAVVTAAMTAAVTTPITIAITWAVGLDLVARGYEIACARPTLRLWMRSVVQSAISLSNKLRGTASTRPSSATPAAGATTAG
jgi:hypothetical protein